MSQSREASDYEKQLVQLGRVLKQLREGSTVGQLIDTALTYIQSEFDYSVVWCGLYDSKHHRLQNQGWRTASGQTLSLKQQIALVPGDLFEQVIMQKRIVGVPDLREESRAQAWQAIAKKCDLQGTILFPVHHQQECLGVFLLGSEIWGASSSPEERAALSMIFGTLASTLTQLQHTQQTQQTLHPGAPLLSLVGQLQQQSDLDERLNAIVAATQQFIAPSRTSVYWFEPEQRCFQRRLSAPNPPGRGGNNGTAPSLELPVQEVRGLYQSLIANQLVVVSDANSACTPDIPGRLFQKLSSEALVAAPIQTQDEFLGFLAIEGRTARIWTETEKQYLQGAAQLAALVAPLSQVEEVIEQAKVDQALAAEISRAIYSDADWRQTLEQCSDNISDRLRAQRFLVLLRDPDEGHFEICYQYSPDSRHPVTSPLPRLNEMDQQMLEQSDEPIAIEDIEHDLKLMAWRSFFLEAKVKSVLLCSTSLGQSLEGLVVVGQDCPRAWDRGERDLIRVISQQIGVTIHQWQLQKHTAQQQQLYQTIQWGVNTIQQTQELEKLEQGGIDHIAYVMDVPLAALITWTPGRPKGKISASVAKKRDFALDLSRDVATHSDNIICWSLQADGILPVTIDDVSAETRLWLSGPKIGQILAMALRTAPDHEPSAVLLVADGVDRIWTERHLEALGMLGSQLAWSRRRLMLTQHLLTQRSALQQLNWYKQRKFEDLYRNLGNHIRRLTELSQQQVSLNNSQCQQVLRQMGGLLSNMTPLLRHEQWKFHVDNSTLPLVSLLKRLIDRANGVIQQNQIWVQVHNEYTLEVGGDVPKIEFVLYELLTLACRRSEPKSRVDIWSRQIDSRWLELSMTDSGKVEPRLLEEIERGRAKDVLAPSILHQPPGLHLIVCQSLMKQLGGEFSFSRLEDGRLFSRVVVPIAKT